MPLSPWLHTIGLQGFYASSPLIPPPYHHFIATMTHQITIPITHPCSPSLLPQLATLLANLGLQVSDALERNMLGFEYGEQDRKAAVLYDNGTLEESSCGYFDPLVLAAEKTKVSKRKVIVVVQSESKGSDDEDISDLKKITVSLAKAFNQKKYYAKATNNNLRTGENKTKAFNQKKYYAKATNNNLRTSSASSLANKKPEYVKSKEKIENKKANEKKRDISKVKCYNCKKEGHVAKDCKKAKVKDYNYYKTKMLLAKKYSDKQVLLAEDQAWMESSSDSNQEINAKYVLYG
nr:hypothetical protein [Tanacetum cinerariifolium]